MTRKEAMEYDDSLKQELKQAAVRFGLAESSGVYIVDHYITVFPEDARKGMIFLGKTPASYKPGNVKIDLKKALAAGLEFAASIGAPESIFHYIQLIIVSAFFIEKSVKQELSGMEAAVVYPLHKNGAYDTGMEEERLINEVQEWYRQKEGTIVEGEKIADAVNQLYRIRTLDLRDGKIYLNEHVWKTAK